MLEQTPDTGLAGIRRNPWLLLGGAYTPGAGPTIVRMPVVFEEAFRALGRRKADYRTLVRRGSGRPCPLLGWQGRDVHLRAVCGDHNHP